MRPPRRSGSRAIRTLTTIVVVNVRLASRAAPGAVGGRDPPPYPAAVEREGDPSHANPEGRPVPGPPLGTARAAVYEAPSLPCSPPPSLPTVPSGPAGSGIVNLPGTFAPGTPFTLSVE